MELTTLIKYMFISWLIFSALYFRKELLGVFRKKKTVPATAQNQSDEPAEEHNFMGSAKEVYYDADFEYHYGSMTDDDVEVILEDFSEVQVHEREMTKEECSEPENCDPVEEFSPEVAGKTYEEILAVLEEAYEPSEDTEKRKKASQTYHDIKASQIIHELRQTPRLLANLEKLAKITED